MQLNVKVVPNSRKFMLRVSEKEIRVWLTEKPENGKANTELVKELGNLLNAHVILVKGHKSSRKTVEIGLHEDEVGRILKEYRGTSES